MTKKLVWIGLFVGSALGNMLPLLWDGDAISLSGFLAHPRNCRNLDRISVGQVSLAGGILVIHPVPSGSDQIAARPE
jgi:hypothetical protein